jgi:hypothetical protein
VEGIPCKGTLGHGFLGVDFIFHNAVYGLTVTPTFRNDPSLTAKRQCEVYRKGCGERLNAFGKCRNCEQRAQWLKGQRAKVGAA